MYLKSKFNFRKFTIALLSFLMAVLLAFSVACNDTSSDDGDDDDGSSSSSTTSVVDYQLIKNGDFEFNTTDTTKYPYASSINWSRSLSTSVTTAPSSTATSGIIDVNKYDDLDSKNKPSVNPGTPYAKGLDTVNNYDADDEEKRVNPNVAGSKILMINNKRNGEGTAQYFRASSSISIQSGEYAKLTLWIKTLDVKIIYSDVTGAYISLSSASSSLKYDDFVIRNIDTKGEWVKLQIAFKGTEINSTTINLTVGLGEGNGLDRNGFAEGCVFLDNVSLEKIDKKAYGELSGQELISDELGSGLNLAGETYVKNDAVDADVKYTTKSYKIDYENVFTTKAIVATADQVAFASNNPKVDYTGNGANKIGVGTYAQVKEVTPRLAELLGENENSFSNFVYMDFADYSSATYTTNEFTLAGGAYTYVSFYVKSTSENVNAEMLKVNVLDTKAEGNVNADKSLFGSIDTLSATEGKYGKWVKYIAFINNPTDTATSFKLEFVFGFVGEAIDSYALQKGYAVIADLSYADTDDEIYNAASAGTTLVKKQIYGSYISYDDVTASETGEDVYGVIVDKTQTFTIMNQPANLVSGFSFSSTLDKNNVQYGIINSKYKDSYSFVSNVDYQSIKESGNTYAQVVVIDNKVAGSSSFVSTSNTVAKNSTSRITVRLRAYDSAVAKVSMVDSNLNDSLVYEQLVFKADNQSKVLSSTVTSNSFVKNGWTTVNFYITAGNEDINFRIKISTETAGTIVFDGIQVTNMEASQLTADKQAITLNFGALSTEGEYKFEQVMHTRPASTVQTTDENGETVESTLYYQPTQVYYGNNYTKFINYSTINADEVIDNTTPVEDSEEDTETDEDSDEYSVKLNATLQISSIIIAVVLILVMIAIVVRNGLKKRAKRIAKTEQYYQATAGFDRNARARTIKKVNDKKSKIALANDDEEYDYDAAQNVDETQEEIVEETFEENNELVVDEEGNLVETEQTEETTEEVNEEVSEEVTEENAQSEDKGE